MDTDAPTAVQPKTRRRWFSFSLRTLLIFVTLTGCGFGWIGLKIQEARRQQVAVIAVEKLGALIDYDYQIDEHGRNVPNATPPGPAWLRALLGDDLFCNVISVYFPLEPYGNRLKHSISDTDLVRNKDFRRLSCLILSTPKGTNDGLDSICCMTNLRHLDLAGAPITDARLDALGRLKQLEFLNLNGTEVTASGVAKLQGVLPNCEIYWH